MKRMICLILLASLMALSVAGCGKEKDTGVGLDTAYRGIAEKRN